MALVAAKCTECKASIEVDDKKEAGICRHCGTAFITEKVINNYSTYVTNNIVLDAETKEKFLNNQDSLKVAQERCEKLLKFEEFGKSFSVANEIIEKWPESPIGYLLAVKSFEEYRTYNKPEYADVIVRRTKSSVFNIQCGYNVLLNVQHPMDEYYQKLLKRLSKEELEKYEDLLETAKAIMLDFSNSIQKELKKKKKRLFINFGITFLILLVFASLIIVSAINNIVGLLVTAITISTVGFFIALYYFIAFLFVRAGNKKLKDTLKN